MSNANIFYTDSGNGIYSVKKKGGAPVKINSGLSNSHGCGWGDGTIYVADKKSVFALPSNQNTLRPMYNLEKVVDISDATGVAIVRSF